MTAPKTKYPIESFGPELMQVLLKGGRGETVTLHFPTRRQGRLFQMRLHTLRQRMREENHPEWKIVMRARTSLKWEAGKGRNDPATLTISQHDSEFREVLERAKIGGESSSIEAPRLEEDPLEKI